MNEIELKLSYPAQQRGSIISYCEQNGFALLGDFREEDFYFTPEGINLLKNDEVLRLRHTTASGTDLWLLTYKCKNVDALYHNRREIETGVADGNALFEMLKRMRFVLIRKVVKTRLQYKKEQTSICLDNVEELGSFMEIEVLGDDAAVAKKRISSILDDLHLPRATIEPQNYLAMLLKKDHPEETHGQNPAL